MSNTILTIDKLRISSKKSGDVLVNNVSFSAPVGEITGIVGESGSGKTLTALSILQLLPSGISVHAGSIEFHPPHSKQSFNLLELNPAEIRNIRGREISMIFQEPMTALNPTMRCGAQIREAMKIPQSSEQSRDDIMRMMKKTGLQNPSRIFSSYPHELSGGQRQRVMISMALISNPKILIADEPTTALDVRVQKEIIQLIKSLQEELSLSVIFISHDLRLLSDIADNIVVMRKGKIVEAGSKKELFNHPSEAYTRGLIHCQPPLDHKPFRLKTIEDFEKNEAVDQRTEKKPNGKHKKDEILNIRNINLVYSKKSILPGRITRGFQALKNIDLVIYEEETLGIVGESGSGKTSLGKSILSLLDTHSGSIWFRGRDISSLSFREKKAFRKKVQVVFQDPYSSLNPKIRIGKLLAEVRKIHFPRESSLERNTKILELIEKTGLSGNDLNKYPHEFSGGQRQRISIARALVTEPELLVLDESVSALDVSVQARILNLLNDLKQEFALSYLFISHDLGVVKYMSDRIIVMQTGEIIEENESDQLYRKPVQPYTRELINSIPGYQNSSGSS